MADYAPSYTSLASLVNQTSGLAGVYWADRGKLNDVTPPAWAQFGYTLMGTGSLTQEAPTKTDIKVEEKDMPISSLFEKGGIMFEGDIPDLAKEVVTSLLGATANADFTNVLDLPESAYKKEGMFLLKPKQGAKAIIFTNAVMVANITGNNTVKETLNIHIQVSAQAGDDSGTYESNAVKIVY